MPPISFSLRQRERICRIIPDTSSLRWSATYKLANNSAFTHSRRVLAQARLIFGDTHAAARRPCQRVELYVRRERTVARFGFLSLLVFMFRKAINLTPSLSDWWRPWLLHRAVLSQ